MEELILKSEVSKRGVTVSVFWGNLDIESIRIEDFATGTHVRSFEIFNLTSKYEIDDLLPGHYRVELKVIGKGIIQKIIRII